MAGVVVDGGIGESASCGLRPVTGQPQDFAEGLTSTSWDKGTGRTLGC